MITQKDMHNTIVRTFDDNSKFELVRSCGGSVEGVKEFEERMANISNFLSETIKKAVDYLNTEV